MRGVIFLLLALTILSLNVSAISVVSDYLVNDTLELIEGASKIYSIRLQNPTENEAGIKLDYATTFMKAIDYKGIYILPPKETGYRILFNVTAPKKPGLYKVGYTVSEVEPSGSGGLPIRLKINRNFNLRVIENPDKLKINYFKVSFIALLLIIIFFLLRKKDKKKFYENNMPKKVINYLFKNEIISKKKALKNRKIIK